MKTYFANAAIKSDILGFLVSGQSHDFTNSLVKKQAVQTVA